jgi:carbonic anhydrase
MRNFIKIIIASVFLVFTNFSFAIDMHIPRWIYDKNDKWGELSPQFKECSIGKEQSPIDILTKLTIKRHLPAIKFNYENSKAEMVNNGHTIQVNLTNGGSVKLISGVYEFLQFHFHTPSEEEINGKRYPMVAHLVHKNSRGNFAVVAVLFAEGRENASLKEIFNLMPVKEGAKVNLQSEFNATSFLPSEHAYYTFKGSLTTPPCTQDVDWVVLKQPVEASKQQIAAFMKIFKMNARPIQPLNGRRIEESL